MRVIKAAFSKTFPISQYYEKVYLEAELNEDDDTRKVLYDLKKQVQDFFYESTAAAEKQMGTHVVEPTTAVLIGNILQDIQSCKDIKVLETYEMLVKNKPDLQNAYDKKFTELKK